MHDIDERCACTHEQDPPYRTTENGHHGLVDVGYMLHGYEQITQENHYNYSYRHVRNF